MTLEDYPLAKAYRWKEPKRDTGGILFLYPLTRSRMHFNHKAGEETEYIYLRHSRPHALNPDDIMADVKVRSDGNPAFLGKTKHKPRGEQS